MHILRKKSVFCFRNARFGTERRVPTAVKTLCEMLKLSPFIRTCFPLFSALKGALLALRAKLQQSFYGVTAKLPLSRMLIKNDENFFVCVQLFLCV